MAWSRIGVEKFPKAQLIAAPGGAKGINRCDGKLLVEVLFPMQGKD